MLTVIETAKFQSLVENIWDEAERLDFIAWIAENSDTGDVIAHTGGMRKVRWSREGMGKRGGARVIYYRRNDRGGLVLLLIYTKAKLDNVRPEFLLKLKEVFDV